MKKNDLILILVIVLISLVGLILPPMFEKKGHKKAVVYFENKVVLEIPLDKKEEYVVKGLLGDVVIVTEEGKVRVKQENSPLHLCSTQGFISKSYETIVCLPNKVVIEIEDIQELDALVK